MQAVVWWDTTIKGIRDATFIKNSWKVAVQVDEEIEQQFAPCSIIAKISSRETLKVVNPRKFAYTGRGGRRRACYNGLELWTSCQEAPSPT